jgi:hypothetical protein
MEIAGPTEWGMGIELQKPSVSRHQSINRMYSNESRVYQAGLEMNILPECGGCTVQTELQGGPVYHYTQQLRTYTRLLLLLLASCIIEYKNIMHHDWDK